jgi:hypothetical protein
MSVRSPNRPNRKHLLEANDGINNPAVQTTRLGAPQTIWISQGDDAVLSASARKTSCAGLWALDTLASSEANFGSR